MQKLIKDIQELQNSPIHKIIETRLKEFQAFKSKTNEEWFQELCFCILAANSKQKTAQNIEQMLGKKLLTISQAKLADFIRNNKHRFHNNKARYIVQARKHSKILKSTINQHLKDGEIIPAREWLVNNILGLGMKEASHFLRNTGTPDLAILDRHILRTLEENNLIKEIPKTLTAKNYLLIEEKFNDLAKQLNISPAKLDLILWYKKTGEVAK